MLLSVDFLFMISLLFFYSHYAGHTCFCKQKKHRYWEEVHSFIFFCNKINLNITVQCSYLTHLYFLITIKYHL